MNLRISYHQIGVNTTKQPRYGSIRIWNFRAWRPKNWRRHFRDDLGVAINFLDRQTWQRPVRVVQYSPRDASGNVPPDFHHDPARHAVALTYLVTLADEDVQLGTTAYGQEAEELLWFSTATSPAPDDFGYLIRDVFLDCLAEAKSLI